MKKIQLFLVMLLLSCLTAAAQSVTATGKVTYADDGSPVIGATIKVKGSSSGATVTDVNGVYKITIPAGARKAIEATFLGLKTATVDVPQSGTYNISMEADATAIEEVVVMGYGSARKMNTTVGSVVQVTSKKIEARPSANALEALSGQVAGLQVYTNGGSPSATQSIRLHGVGSLYAGNTPLYILDGMPIDASTIVSLNPNDMESISVLKDASATSIYGSRAANGVIFMTSKRGNTSQRAKVTVRSQYGISDLANRDFYNRMMGADELRGFWRETGIRTDSQIASYDKYTADTRWIDFYQSGGQPTYQNDVSIQGGGGKTTYFISGSQYHADGTTPGTYYDRYTVRANVESQANSWLKVGVNMTAGEDKRANNSQYGVDGSSNSTTGGLSFLQLPFYSFYGLDGKGEETNRMTGSNAVNPRYYAETHPDDYTQYNMLGSAFVEIEPVKNLKIRSRAGINYYSMDNPWMTLPSYDGSLGNGLSANRNDIGKTKSITNTIEYKWNVAQDHDFTLLAGQEGTSYFYKTFYAQSSGQTDDRLIHLNNGLQETYAMSSSNTAYNYLSFFGRLDYSWKNKLYADVSVRNDSSSRFGKNNKSATFWAVGAMWDIKKENFLKDNNTVTDLRLKASYGTQGNSSIGNYESLATVAETTSYGEKKGWVVNTPGNPDLSWEVQKKFTVGASLTLWNKLRINAEYYNRTTDNMLMNVPKPSTTGFSSVLENVGSMNNQGIDLDINYDIFTTPDAFINVSATFNYNDMKITKLFGGRDVWEIANTGVTYKVGSPVMYYYPIFAGINPETGKQQWYKANPDDNTVTQKDPNKITENFSEAGTQNTGKKRYAPFAGGFGISGGWKGIVLRADFSYVLGKTMISNDRYFSENPFNFPGFNTSNRVADYWKKPGDITEYPAWGKGEIMQFDTHLMDNASFLRLKNLTIEYSLPAKWLEKSNILRGARISFTGRNLFTITNFKGIDPEPDANLSYGVMANSKQYTVGLELIF